MSTYTIRKGPDGYRWTGPAKKGEEVAPSDPFSIPTAAERAILAVDPKAKIVYEDDETE
jgi:hypothetical protein